MSSATRKPSTLAPQSCEPTDDEIIRANVAHVVANPAKLYDHLRGELDAIAVLELGISERQETIRQHRISSVWHQNEWSSEVVNRLEREIRMIDRVIQELRASGIDTTSPLALQVRRERENPPPSFRDLVAAALQASGLKLSGEAAALLDPESPVPGVTTGKIRDELRHVARLHGADLNVTAGWGIASKGGIVMPAKGKVTPVLLDIQPGQTPVWPDRVCVHLNDTTSWDDVPWPVWTYTLGGYQVLKKWLSYRECRLLGRALTSDEARDFTHHARRIAALLLLAPDLDASYGQVKPAAHSTGN